MAADDAQTLSGSVPEQPRPPACARVGERFVASVGLSGPFLAADSLLDNEKSAKYRSVAAPREGRRQHPGTYMPALGPDN